MHAAPSPEKPHTERWAYRRLYTPNTFDLATRLYPFLHRPGFQLVSRTVAWTYAVTQPAIRRIVRNNLSLLRKEPVTDGEAIKVFVNYGATIADYVAVGAMPREKAHTLCVEHEGVEHLKNATRDGKGAILVTGHYSFFELGTVSLHHSGYKSAIATMPEPTSALTEWRARWRARWDTETIPVGADPFSALQVIRAIDAGRCMAMLADRPIGEAGLPVDLPNGRIPFSTSPALLSWMTGRPILPNTITRLPGGGYRVTTKPPIEARRDANRASEVNRCTHEIARSLFEEIQRDPLQWYQFIPVGL